MKFNEFANMATLSETIEPKAMTVFCHAQGGDISHLLYREFHKEFPEARLHVERDSDEYVNWMSHSRDGHFTKLLTVWWQENTERLRMGNILIWRLKRKVSSETPS
jgi:hypothetical protein